MNKLGMHIHGIKPGIIGAVALLQPRTITIMDPTAQELRDIYAVADPMTVVRKYEDGKSFQQVDPQWWAEEYYRMVGDAVSNRLIALGMNEPFGHDAQPLCAPFDEWNRAFIERCRELGPMDGGALAMATGNWTGADDRYKINEDFPLTCGIAKYFLPHEYCWPTLEAGVPWYVLRYRAWIEDLEAIGREDFSFIISEAGLTQAIIAGRPDHGYRSGGPEGVTEDSYISTIDWYNARLCEDRRVLGCCLYDWAGSHYGWETFEQLGLEHRIYQIQAPEPPEPPEPPEEDQVIRVFDLDGIELFGEAALDRIAFHGITVHEPENMREGEWYWAVVRMRESVGPACFIYTGLLEDGSPAAGQQAAWAWTDDMGEADDILGNNYPTDWQLQADLGTLNENGNMGPAYGQHGWFKLPYVAGPGRAWIRDPLRWSVKLTGMGMLDMTNHHTMFATWQLMQWEGNGEPPTPPPDGELLEEVKEIRLLVAEIRDLLKNGVPPDPEPPKGYFGQYFNNRNLEGVPAVEQWDDAIFFDWGSGPPAEGINADNFSVRWTATRHFEAGLWSFHVRVDDGVRLFVDGELLIEQWHDQSPKEYSAHKVLSVGEHTIKMEYYEKGGGAVAEMWYVKV